MPDSNAIFDAAQSLVELFKGQMTPEPVQAPELIGICTPHEPEDYQITVWIYQIEEISDGTPGGYIRHPYHTGMEIYAPTRLTLHGLVSVHSKAPVKTRLSDEYRIVGRALQVVKDNPVISRAYLSGALGEGNMLPNLSTAKITQEDLNRIWNNASKPLKPSFPFQISPIEISSNRTRKIAKRVVEYDFNTVHKKEGEDGK